MAHGQAMCAYCRTVLMPGMMACARCGKPAPDPSAVRAGGTCPTCGQHTSVNARFCAACGTALTDEARSRVPAGTAPAPPGAAGPDGPTPPTPGDTTAVTPGGLPATPGGLPTTPGGPTATSGGPTATLAGATATPGGFAASPGGSTATPGGPMAVPGGRTAFGLPAGPGGAPGAPEIEVSGTPPKGLLLGLGAAAVVLVVLVGALYAVQTLAFGPKSAVSGYFDALAARDAKAAWQATGGAGPLPSTLRDAMLRKGSGYSPPTDVSIGEVTEHDDSATARVRFRLSGTTYKVSIGVQRDEDKSWLLFHGWHLTRGTSSLTIEAAGVSAVTVDGVTVRGSSDGYSSGVTVPVFLGSYAVGIAPNTLLEAERRTVSVVSLDDGEGDGAGVRLTTSVKQSAHDAVDKAVRTLLDDCAKQTTLDPDGCPFSYYSYEDATDVRWTITKYPTFDVTQDESSGNVYTSTTDGGTADVKYTYQGYDGKTAKGDESVDFDVDGTVTVEGGGISWRPSGY